jgi:hypothetical protein
MILPAAIAAVMLSGGARRLSRLRPWLGLAAVGVSVLPWVIPYALTPGHRKSQSLGLRAALDWYLDRQAHGSSVPLDSAFVAFLPWALWLVAALVWWWRAPDSAPYRPVWGWTLVLALLVAASVQQRARYALPLFPPLAILVAGAATAASARVRAMTRLYLVIMAALGAALLVGGVWLLVALRSAPAGPVAEFMRSAPWEVGILIGLALGGTAAAVVVLWRGGSPLRAMGWLAGAMGIIVLVQAVTYPARRTALTPVAAFSEEIGRVIGPAEPLVAFPDANLAFDFYLDRLVTEEPRRERIALRLQQPAMGGLLLREAGLRELRSMAHPSWGPQAHATLGARPYVLLGRCR